MALLVREVILELGVTLDKQVRQVEMEDVVNLAYQDKVDLQVNQGHLEYLVKVVQQVCQGKEEMLEILDNQDP